MDSVQNPETGETTTCFAPAERVSGVELQKSLDFVVHNPILDVLLRSVGGLMAILNEQRQILAVNEAFSSQLGLASAAEVLGLRPGEAVHCIHAGENPGGCGTSGSCAACGAVLSILACLGSDEPVERVCSITVRDDNKPRNLYFDIRAYPLLLEGHRLVLLFLRNATDDQRRSSLERVFFDEISGTIAGALGRSKLLLTADADKAKILSGDIFKSLLKVAQEIRIQKRLMQG